MVPEVLIWNEGTRTPENVTDQHFGGEHNNERNMTTLHECNIPIASRPHNPHCLRCLTKCNKELFEPTWPLEPKCDVATRAKMAIECGSCGGCFGRAKTRSLCRQLRRLIVQCRGSTTEPDKGRKTCEIPVPSHLGVRLLATSAPPSPRQLTAVSQFR